MATFPANVTNAPIPAIYNSPVEKGTFGASVTIPPGVVETQPPTVTVISPAVGTPIARDAFVVLEIADDFALRRVTLWVEYAGLGRDEVIYNGEEIRPPFTRDSTLVAAGSVRRFTLRPDRGWPDSPRFRVLPIDTDGNEPA